MDSVMKNATVHPVPKAGFSALNACSGSSIQFTDTSDISTGAIVSWQWDFGDGINALVQHPTHSYTNPGTSHVT